MENESISLSLISSQVDVIVFRPPHGMPNSVKSFSIHWIFGILKAFKARTHTQRTTELFLKKYLEYALEHFLSDANTTNAQTRMNECIFMLN
jgi:hypothetical protein